MDAMEKPKADICVDVGTAIEATHQSGALHVGRLMEFVKSLTT